ncbi:Na+ dependent nucleoside transporter NupC [Aeromonas salmonicida]|nr:Na+ dependent nucleoside transporter NupC [Aeromonas salmonicida]
MIVLWQFNFYIVVFNYLLIRLINLKTFVLSNMHIFTADCDGYLIFKYAYVYDGAHQI